MIILKTDFMTGRMPPIPNISFSTTACEYTESGEMMRPLKEKPPVLKNKKLQKTPQTTKEPFRQNSKTKIKRYGHSDSWLRLLILKPKTVMKMFREQQFHPLCDGENREMKILCYRQQPQNQMSPKTC